MKEIRPHVASRGRGSLLNSEDGGDQVMKRYDEWQPTKTRWPEAIKRRRLEGRRTVVDGIARKV
jgi:hypothetical protein